METVTRAETRLWQIDVVSGLKTRLTPEGQVAYGGGVYSADGKGVFLTTDAEGEFRRLARLDLASGAIQTLTRGINWDVEDVALSSDGRYLAFTANEAGVGTLYLYDTQRAKAARVKGVPAGSVQGIEWRRGSTGAGLQPDVAENAMERVLDRRLDGQGRAVDARRHRHGRCLADRRRRAGVVEEFRRPRDFRLHVSAARAHLPVDGRY